MGGELSGRSALVTGATRGIGRAVVLRFHRGGARLFLVARGAGPLRELAREVGGRALPADVVDPGAVAGAVGAVEAELGGPPDILVNAAGVFGLAPISETAPEELERQLAVNLRGPFLLIRALLPGMLRRGSGHIISIGSVAGRRPFPGNGAYAASKFALRGLHGVLLEEIRGTGVRATLVEAAATDTSLWDGIDRDRHPGLPERREMLSPEEVAEAVFFAASRPPGVQVPVLRIERSSPLGPGGTAVR